MSAGRRAGLIVERILNEPTAAALSYGLDHMDEESHVLVYDLGGGTFDVTLLEMFDGVLEVKASSGDNQLGGKDFDEKICEWMIREFHRKTGVNPSKDPYAMVRIKDEAERCKKMLSTQESVSILLPALAKKENTPLDLDLELTVVVDRHDTAPKVPTRYTEITTMSERDFKHLVEDLEEGIEEIMEEYFDRW